MSEMVERVERVIFQHCRREDDQPGHYMTVAEAVIEVMREPTEAMTMALEHLATEFDGYAAWQAMIDEALK